MSLPKLTTEAEHKAFVLEEAAKSSITSFVDLPWESERYTVYVACGRGKGTGPTLRAAMDMAWAASDASQAAEEEL